MEQRFALPELPLHRELQAPVTIGTQFSVRATPIEHEKRSLTLALVTNTGEAALEITIFFPERRERSGKVRAISRTATIESSPHEKEVSTIALGKELVLGVVVKEHVFEIYLDTLFLLSFVHRVNPSEIVALALDGAAICSQLVVVPVQTDLPPLPAYSELSLNGLSLQPTRPPRPPSPYVVPQQQQPPSPYGNYPQVPIQPPSPYNHQQQQNPYTPQLQPSRPAPPPPVAYYPQPSSSHCCHPCGGSRQYPQPSTVVVTAAPPPRNRRRLVRGLLGAALMPNHSALGTALAVRRVMKRNGN